MKEKSKIVLAKPSGILLEEHAEHVIAEGHLLTSNLPASCEKYERLVGKTLTRRVELACKWHDEGKRSVTWQTACRKDFQRYQEWLKKYPVGTFQEYSRKEGISVGENLRRANVRHELYSLKLLKQKSPLLWLQAAIAAHHRKLSYGERHRWEENPDPDVKEAWKNLQILSNQLYESKTELSEIAHRQYEYAGPRGLLQLADHRASAKEEQREVPHPSTFVYTFPESWEKRPVQKIVEEHWADDLLLVRAPTGAGKTDAALLWASLQIRNKRADRLVIAMPTRFTSNALAVNVADTLSDTGLYHSGAWLTRFDEQLVNGSISLEQARFSHEQARLLQTPTTVCTIDHLLASLTLSREEHHITTFSLANSCLVIDEADFYDNFTQANILVLLRLLRAWRVPVLIMSASLPDIVVQEYKALGYQIKEILEDTSDNERIRFELLEKRDVSDITEMEDLLRLCKDEPAIIYANTVDRAQMYYDWFCEQGLSDEVVLYHSRFTEPDKKEKERLLLSRLGRQAWKSGKARGVAILTQIGEMSVNISADLMISDLCPIDRLTQRCGRLCRFDFDKIGRLYLIRPFRGDNIFPAPYYQNSKEKTPNEAFLKTDDLLIKEKYSATKLVTLLNQVYCKNEYTLEAINNAKELEKSFKINWLINPAGKVSEDDAYTHYWHARNFMPQCRVYIASPPSIFYNSSEFIRWESMVSVDIPAYVLKNVLRKYKDAIRDVIVLIGNEKTTLRIVRGDCYDLTRGLYFAHLSLEEPSFELL